ncbi:STM4013/SEN3800 family hydrolase, partial [Micromonospora echinofusca]
PGPHPRLFAAAFPGSVSATEDTWVFDAPDVVTALAGRGYHTVCVGGVGFFNPASPLGRVLPGLFAEAHWEPEFGVTAPGCFEAQLDRVDRVVATVPAGRPLFLFLNVAALHQPNRHYLPGTADDDLTSHAAALAYVDRHIGRLFAAMTGRGRPCLVVLCSDHGTAYGEDGHTGHRFGHEVVWTVPYAQVVLEPGTWNRTGTPT